MFYEESIMAKRLSVKNDSQTMIQNLVTRYSLSIAEAESLDNEMRIVFKDSSYLEDGQEFFTAIDVDEPPGKPLKQCKTRRIKLTVRSKKDLEIRSQQGLRGYFRITISRLCWEALEQNALLTQEDLAFLLNLSRASVKRFISEIKKQGDYIPTRGNYHDIGPGLSHKYQAVRFFIKGAEPSDIALKMGHALNSIERYIENFSLVVAASLEDYNAIAISRFTGISEKVVREYLVLYDRYTLDPDLKPFLENMIQDFRERKLLKKMIEG
jgi:biotin operon repressor